MRRLLKGFIRSESASPSDSQKTKRSRHHKSRQHRLRHHRHSKYFQNPKCGNNQRGTKGPSLKIYHLSQNCTSERETTEHSPTRAQPGSQEAPPPAGGEGGISKSKYKAKLVAVVPEILKNISIFLGIFLGKIYHFP